METISKGIVRESLHERRVVVYTVEALGVQTLVDWSKAITDTLDQWPVTTNYVAVHDLSSTGMSIKYLLLTSRNILDPWLTPTSETRFRHWMKQRPNTNVRLAVVVSAAMSGQIAMQRGRGTKLDHPQLESRVFDDRDAALEWAADRPWWML